MNEHKGANAIQNEDRAVTAKRIRDEIKARVQEGKLEDWKYSVRLSRFSMGSSIDIKITVPERHWDGWTADNVARGTQMQVEALVRTFQFTRDSGMPDDYYWCSFYSNTTLVRP